MTEQRDATSRAVVERHRRHVEVTAALEPAVRDYALMVCDDILNDLPKEAEVTMTQAVYEEFLGYKAEFLLRKTTVSEIAPRQPTHDMVEAMVRALFDMDHSDLKWSDAMNMARKAYRAAINAAPQGSPGSISGEAKSRIADVPAVAAPVYGHEHQIYPGGPIYRAGTSTGVTLPEQPSVPSASVRISMKDARLIQSVLESVHSELRPGNATIWADNVRDSRKALDEAIHG